MGYTGAIVSAGIALDTLQYTVHEGEKAKGLGKRRNREQEAAQNQAETAMVAERIRAQQAEAQASREPDPFAILAFENDPSKGLGSSVPRSQLKTSGPTLLGDA